MSDWWLQNQEDVNTTNKEALVDPGVNDDSANGFEINSKWTNSVSNATFSCVDATPGVAVWRRIDNVVGVDSDEKAKVSANDTTAGFLNGKLVAGTNMVLVEGNDGGDETLTLNATGGAGEANTVSNQGAGGVGVFKQKTGVDFELRNINAGSNKVAVTLDAPNNEIDIDVSEANLNMANLIMARIAGSTFSSVQHVQDSFHSTGVTNAGSGFISDDADGTITVAAGTGQIRPTNSSIDQLLFTDWSAEAGANVALVDNDLNYIYVEYNAGTPRVIATTTKRTDLHTNILLGNVYRAGTTLHITNQNVVEVSDHALNMIKRLKGTIPFAQESGGIIGETGTRNLTVSAGVFWQGLTSFTTTDRDTSVADTFSAWHRNGGWTELTAQTQIDNLQYDNGTGLATLANNQFGVHWVYLEADGEFVVVYGQDSYTLSGAEAAAVPAGLPPSMEDHAFIIGKIIIGKSDAVFTTIESAFDTIFQGGLATDHGDLIGLGDDDHTIYHNDARGDVRYYTQTQVDNLVINGGSY